jgi:hypothetical protein
MVFQTPEKVKKERMSFAPVTDRKYKSTKNEGTV